MVSQVSVAPNQRLSREGWLAQALETLAQRGDSKIRIEQISQDLGVTKGSFYWHFKSREDFVRKLAEFWERKFNRSVASEIGLIKRGPEARLLALMELLFQGNHARYDLAVRAWATQEPAVAELVTRADELRMTFVRSLFEEMGFKGRELQMRTRTFVCFHSLEHGLFAEQTDEERKKLLKLRHKLFTRP